MSTLFIEGSHSVEIITPKSVSDKGTVTQSVPFRIYIGLKSEKLYT